MKDYQIRKIVRETELLTYIEDNNSKIIEEMDLSVAGARIDIAVLNGAFHGYEIKSASDNLDRLPHQIVAYSYIFDYLTIVTEEEHYKKIKKITPSWVYIAICENDCENKITFKHKGRKNPKKDGFFIAQLLWRSELFEILNENNIFFKKKYTNWKLCKILSEKIDSEILSNIVRVKMKMREKWR